MSDGVDVKVTLDNPALPDPPPDPLPDPTPGFDAKNQPPPETSLAISPVNPAIVAVVAIDSRMFVPPRLVALWAGLHVFTDGSTTWFNTFVPGFRAETSAAGLASPLHGFASASDL